MNLINACHLRIWSNPRVKHVVYQVFGFFGIRSFCAMVIETKMVDRWIFGYDYKGLVKMSFSEREAAEHEYIYGGWSLVS